MNRVEEFRRFQTRAAKLHCVQLVRDRTTTCHRSAPLVTELITAYHNHQAPINTGERKCSHSSRQLNEIIGISGMAFSCMRSGLYQTHEQVQYIIHWPVTRMLKVTAQVSIDGNYVNRKSRRNFPSSCSVLIYAVSLLQTKWPPNQESNHTWLHNN